MDIHKDMLNEPFPKVPFPELPVNQAAPDFTLPDLDGIPHRLKDFRGKSVILNFGSAEGPHCQRVDEELYRQLLTWGNEVILLTIASNANESPELIRQAAPNGKGHPILLDSDQQTANLFGAKTTPHLFVVDRDGILRYRGAYNDVSFRQRVPTRAYLTDAVTALLCGGLPDLAETKSFGCVLVR